MSVANYELYREKIKSGDLLIWSTNKGSLYEKIYLYIIRLFTLSSYAHIGVALWLNGRLCVVEATQPVVRIIPISLSNNFYHMPMNIDLSDDDRSWLLDKIGNKYSMLKALKSYFLLDLKVDDTWQCVQLVSEFYKRFNIEVDNSHIPNKFIDFLLDDINRHLVKVKVR